jgi:hypothetical protein
MILASLALVASVAVFDMPAAQAQVATPKNPWCLRDGTSPGSWDCSYYNFRQCEESSRGVGGSCSRNPEYRGARQSNNRRQNRPDGMWDRW